MKVKSLIFDVNHYAVSDGIKRHIDLYKSDPYLIMSETTAKMLRIAFSIQEDKEKHIFVANNILNGRSKPGEFYTGKYTVLIDNSLEFGVIDIR